MPLVFFVFPLVDLLGRGTLGEQDRQDNEKKLFWHNSLQPGFFRTCPGVLIFFQSLVAANSPLPGVDRWLAVAARQPLATEGQQGLAIEDS